MKRQRRFAIGFLLVTGLPLTASAQYASDSSPVRLVSGSTATVESDNVSPETKAAGNVFPSLSQESNASQPTDTDEPSGLISDQLVGPAITVSSSLVVVLGLFAGLVWITRKFGGRGMNNRTLPSDVVQSLGSTSIDARTRLTLVRCGQRILVLSQTASGVQPVAEITDHDEVTALTATCIGNSKAEFAATLHSIEREKAQSGYLGSQTDATNTPPRRQLFTTA